MLWLLLTLGCEPALQDPIDGLPIADTGAAPPPFHPRSCQEWHDFRPNFPSGVYTIGPRNRPVDVFCDMDVDGGGWTLVSSSNRAVDDKAVGWDPLLTSLAPNGAMTGIWLGMRTLLNNNQSDIRFVCTFNGRRAVDLSFYENPWYRQITEDRSDANTCFQDGNGAGTGVTPPPARRNNVNGRSLSAGDPWDYGYLEGEDGCASPDDFTIDFDDRGMDNNQADGTDWGVDDSTEKCGTQQGMPLNGAQWFIFFRELP